MTGERTGLWWWQTEHIGCNLWHKNSIADMVSTVNCGSDDFNLTIRIGYVQFHLFSEYVSFITSPDVSLWAHVCNWQFCFLYHLLFFCPFSSIIVSVLGLKVSNYYFCIFKLSLYYIMLPLWLCVLSIIIRHDIDEILLLDGVKLQSINEIQS